MRKLLEELAPQKATLVFFLPTRKIPEFLAATARILGDRRVVIARELTKVHEEFLRGTASEIATAVGSRTLKGEATILVEGLR